METKKPIENSENDNEYFLGKNNDTAYYFYYKKEEITTLNNDFLKTINTKASNYIILLCDEPTGALDTENARQVISVLQKLTKQRGIPVMMITHNPCFSALAGHCITMSNGRIVEEVYQPFPLDVENIVLK